MLTTKEVQDLEARGFVFDDNGNPKWLNGNEYAQFIKSRMTLIYTNGGVFYEYVNGVYKIIADLELKKRLRNILHEPLEGTWTSSREQFYLQALEREVAYTNQLNPYMGYVNVLNGMVSLKDFSLKDHSPKYYSTAQIPCKYDVEATCPEFIRYLNTSFANDQTRVALAQQWLAYFLTSSTKAQKALILYGSGGNGKGIFSTIIQNLVGDENISC